MVFGNFGKYIRSACCGKKRPQILALGLDQIHFGGEEIWRPDIELYNSADTGQEEPFRSTHFVTYNDGMVLWVPPAKFKAFCKVKFGFVVRKGTLFIC